MLRNSNLLFSCFRLIIIVTLLKKIIVRCIPTLREFLMHYTLGWFKYYYTLRLKILIAKFVVFVNLPCLELIFKALYYIWFVFHSVNWISQKSSWIIIITINIMSLILILDFEQLFFEFICYSNLESLSFNCNFVYDSLNYLCTSLKCKIFVVYIIYIEKLTL